VETNKSKINQLLQKYKEGNCSLEEIERLQHMLSNDDSEDQHTIDQVIVANLLQPSSAGNMSESKLKITLENIKRQIQQDKERGESIKYDTADAGVPSRRKVVFVTRWLYWTAAACLLLFVISMAVWRQHRDSVQVKKNLATLQSTKGEVVKPGGNSATLRLADGTLLELDKQASGIVMGKKIAYENGKSIADAALYKQGGEADPSKVMLELTTPRGGMYQITLPDGTKVWLNAASSLIYPLSFAKNERKVTLIGEAFFEVIKDSTRPFKVLSKEQEIEVLGTAFNVNAYPENTAIKTTLVHGRVKLSNDNRYSEATYLQPGQQSTNTNSGDIQVAPVDTAPFTAWKDGLFYFEETPLSDALQQIGRWYNIKVRYKGEVPQTHFYGRIKRSKPLQEVLDVLEEGGLRFELMKSQEKNILLVTTVQ